MVGYAMSWGDLGKGDQSSADFVPRDEGLYM